MSKSFMRSYNFLLKKNFFFHRKKSEKVINYDKSWIKLFFSSFERKCFYNNFLKKVSDNRHTYLSLSAFSNFEWTKKILNVKKERKVSCRKSKTTMPWIFPLRCSVFFANSNFIRKKLSFFSHPLCLSLSELTNYFSLSVLSTYCTHSSKDSTTRSRGSTESLKTFLKILKLDCPRLCIALAALIASSAFQLYLPLIFGRFVDSFSLFKEAVQIVSSQLFFCIACILLGGLSTFFRLYLLETSIERISCRLRSDLFKSILKKNLHFFETRTTGELINKLSNDIAVTSRILIDISFALRNFLGSIVGIVMIISLAPLDVLMKLTLPMVFSLGGIVIYARYVKRFAEEKQKELSKAIHVAEEKISNIRSVRLFNGEKLEGHNFDIQLGKVYKAAIKSALFVAGKHCILFTVIGGVLLHLIYNAAFLVSSGVLSVGEITTLLMYSLMSSASMQSLVTVCTDIQKALGSCSEVLKIIEDKENAESSVIPRLPNSVFNNTHLSDTLFKKENSLHRSKKSSNSSASAETSLQKPNETHAGIQFRNIFFAYPSRPDCLVLNDFNLHIPYKSTVCVIGESGNGKSTLSLLLNRMYEVDSGGIYINNVNIQSINPHILRSMFSVVSQDAVLFADNIKGNILYAKHADDYFYENMTSEDELIFQDFFDHNARRKEERLFEETNLNDSEEHKAKKKFSLFIERHRNKEGAFLDQNTSYDSYMSIRDAMKYSLSDKFIRNFPQQLDTYVGERGIHLSGGERQRICLARALVKNAEYFIFDELTSSLDPMTENSLLKTLYNDAMKNRTCLIITHRLSTLKFSDYVAVISNGAIAEFCSTKYMLKNKSKQLERILNINDEKL